MDTRVWVRSEEKSAVVLALTGDALYRLAFTGKQAGREATEAAKAIEAGQAPARFVTGTSKSMPLAAIGRVEVSHGLDAVKVVARAGETPIKLEFRAPTGVDAPGIARAVVERAAISHPERPEPIGAVEALLPPVILGVIAGLLWAVVYGASTTLEDGGEIEVDRGGRRGRGLKMLVVFIARMLGANGTLVLGALLLAFFLAWVVRRIVKRPQRLVWGPPAT